MTSYPSQVISVYIDNKVAHITIDSGATVSFIVESEAKRLNLEIQSASQLARQADGCTMMHIIGEVHGKANRGMVDFVIHALVVPKLDGAQILAGMNFLMENKVCQEPFKRRIIVDNKYTIEETPAALIYPSTLPFTKTVKIKKIKALFNEDVFEFELPGEYPPNSKVIVDSTDQANRDKNWLFQEIEAVNRTLKIVNDSGHVKTLGKNKDTSIIKIRPVVDIKTVFPSNPFQSKDVNAKSNYWLQEDTKSFVTRINKCLPQEISINNRPNPMDYLKDIYIEQGVMSDSQANRLQEILIKYHKVFDGDISEGYNNASGAFDVDWTWLNEQKPPPGVSRQEVYTNEEMKKSYSRQN